MQKSNLAIRMAMRLYPGDDMPMLGGTAGYEPSLCGVQSYKGDWQTSAATVVLKVISQLHWVSRSPRLVRSFLPAVQATDFGLIGARRTSPYALRVQIAG
jgi:hypothetical protein